MPDLFAPLALGARLLPNRIAMSALTRCRARHPGGLATPQMARYYAQRAGAGLILSEGIAVEPRGVGYDGITGLWSAAQTASWRQVTEAVHQAGGRIYAQLWHVGRLSDPAFLNGARPLAPSPIAATGTVTRLRPKKAWEVPEEMSRAQIDGVITAFDHAAKAARAAGFDGVDLHGANGYLIDQFLQNGSNQRGDCYGGSVSNRLRFLSELLEVVKGSWAPEEIALHLSPRDGFSMFDSDPEALFGAVADLAQSHRLGLIYLREEPRADAIAPLIRRRFKGALALNSRLTPNSARAILSEGRADLVGFGRAFIANPDLPARLKHGIALAEPDPATFYDGGDEGYCDYPAATLPET